jgi:N-methylhydantoinase B
MSRANDPTSLELIRNALESIADAMAITLYRTSRSAVVRLGWDFSTAVLTVRGDLVGQGMCHPIHLGGMMPALHGCLARYRDDVQPGDILITNDPYEGAQHLPDVYLFKPVFYRDRLVGYVGAICHQSDIGGRVPGGQGFDNTEIYQEGLRIPPLKFYERGEPNETLYRLIEKAVRSPEQVIGDLTAEVTSVNLGERELVKVVERFGLELYDDLIEDLLDYTEQLTRDAIRTLPDGSWRFADYLDGDGITNEPIQIEVRVTKAGDRIHVDFDGTSPQRTGSIVGLFHMNTNFVHMALRCLLGSDLPSTAGFFRPITITAPAGTFVNPLPPAAVGARQVGGRRINHAVWGALAQMAPDRVFACPGGCDGGIATSGVETVDGTRRSWVLTEGFNETACGGRPDKDGMDGQGSNITNQANTPVELLEIEHPLKVIEYGLVSDTEGAGKFRGGLAMVRTYEYLSGGTVARVRFDRTKRPPWGLFGGQSPSPPHATLVSNGHERDLPGNSTVVVNGGDRLATQWCGAGGYGDPLERDPERVLADVIEEKVSAGRARDVYGVVIDRVSCAVDVEATQRRRAELRASSAA